MSASPETVHVGAGNRSAGLRFGDGAADAAVGLADGPRQRREQQHGEEDRARHGCTCKHQTKVPVSCSCDASTSAALDGGCSGSAGTNEKTWHSGE